MYEYTYKKTGKKLYLHRKISGSNRSFVWYFTGCPDEAVDLPEFLEIVESSRSGYPFVRKKKTGGI